MNEINVKKGINVAKEYIGVQNHYLSELAETLWNLVTREGKDIYLDDERLQQALNVSLHDKKEVFKVCLMTKVPGLRELVNKNFYANRNDLDRFIHNAIRVTGLNRAEVMRLTRDIAFSLDAEFDYVNGTGNRNNEYDDAYTTLPIVSYEQQLENFRGFFIKARNNPKSLRGLDYKSLEPIVAAGIPKAKYYLGYCLVFGSELEEVSQRGLALLEQAVESGDVEASAALGDYYYQAGGSNNWSRAYEHYTGYGAMALTTERRDAVTNILNHGLFNKKMIIGTILLFVVLSAITLIAPGSFIYGAYRGIGIFCMLLEFVILGVMVMHYKVKPYDDFYIFPTAIFAIHFLYCAIRMIF